MNAHRAGAVAADPGLDVVGRSRLVSLFSEHVCIQLCVLNDFPLLLHPFLRLFSQLHWNW